MRDIFTASGEEIATWLHDTYEAIAKEKGWGTQKITQVEFKKLPKENQEVMLELAQSLQLSIADSLTKHYPYRRRPEEGG